MKRIVCVPSILAADLSRAAEAAAEIRRAGLEWIHFDVMDGVYVPNLSFGFQFVSDVMKTSSLKSDVHLMVRDPDATVGQFLPLCPEILTFHVEATPDPAGLLSRLKDSGIPCPGISLNPETPVDRLEPFLAQAGLVLVMTVQPGFYGQAYIRGIESKVRELDRIRREKGLSFLIEVDGGIDRSTLPFVEEYADHVVAGAAFFRSEEQKAFLRDLGYTPG